MGRLRITQIRSACQRIEPQKRTIRALGFRKLHQSVEHDDNPVIRGMIARVFHLVKVVEIGAGEKG